MIALKGRRPIYFGLVALVLGCFLLWGFVSALIHSSPGEVAEAIGSVVGGIFGAGGAVGAVYFLIDRQRHEDANNVSDAIRREIIIFTEVVIEALSICEHMISGNLTKMRKNAPCKLFLSGWTTRQI